MDAAYDCPVVNPRVVLLCGGRGTRMYPETASVPKPLIDVCGRPVVHHVMASYADHGLTDFVLATGYKHELLVDFAATIDQPWKVEVIDTGLDTNTGGRVRALADVVGDRFFVTYADGLSDIDITAALAFHQAHGRAATMTTVPLPSQYGVIEFEPDGRVTDFVERPVLTDRYINAGFFIFDRRCFDLWPSPGDDLEREVLPAFGSKAELFAYRHHGYWRSLDTGKDVMQVNAECGSGNPPWRRR